jgi:uncharacterized protein (DUF1778 family)
MATARASLKRPASNLISRRKARFEARVPVHMKRQWERAAALTGATLSDFVIRSAQTEAEKTIEKYEVLVLNEKASRAFFELMMNPPPPNARLLAAARRHKQRVIEL